MRKDTEAKQTKERLQYVKRVIVHPAFHNISFAEAEKFMENMAQGEVIIRPSSKVSWSLVTSFLSVRRLNFFFTPEVIIIIIISYTISCTPSKLFFLLMKLEIYS